MIPLCSTQNSVLAADLEALAKLGAVEKIRLIPTNAGCYVVAHIRNATGSREVFLTTRRDRVRPRTFKDQTRLYARLLKDYKGVQVNLDLGSPRNQT